MRKQQFIIWFAGFFDGEGSVGAIKTSANRYTVYLYVYQKNLDTLRKIRHVLGGKLSNPRYKASSWQRARRMGHLQWSGDKARQLATLIQPYLQTSKAVKVRKVLQLPKPKYYKLASTK